MQLTRRIPLIGVMFVAALHLPAMASALELIPAGPRAAAVPFLARPNAEAGPTKVSVAMWLVDIDSIDSAAQNFTVNLFIALRWKDPRLRHRESGPKRYELTQIWNPRILIANEIGIVRRGLPDIAEVEPDGTVVYRQRFVGPFSQPLKLGDFPFDRHVFRLHAVSPGNRPDEVQFVPDEPWVSRGLRQAAGIADDISLPDWKIEGWEAKSLPYTVAPGAETAGYAFEFTAKRDSEHYVWKVILPLILIAMMSWTVFWIDPVNPGTQIGVATTSMLTLIAYRFAVDLQVPRLPYMTRLDKFILANTVLVFFSLVHVILTSGLVRLQRGDLAKRFDRYSRVVFPLALAVVVGLFLMV